MKTKAKYARVVTIGKRQAVLLPVDIKFEGKRVLVSSSGEGLLVKPYRKPMFRNIKEWFAALDGCNVPPDFLQELLDERAAEKRERIAARRMR